MYFFDIQFLRGLSIIVIVLFHLNIFKNGYIGVDVLFLITGFLMRMTYDNKIINYITFISNRLIRIFPLLHSTLFIHLFLFINEDNEKLLELLNEIKYCLSFICNYYYQKMEKDYFHPSKSAKFLNIWAVCVEMQYYFICSVFILYQKVNLIVIILSILYYIYKNTELYYSLLGRIFEFNIGIEVYKLKSNNKYSYYYKISVLILIFLFPYQYIYKYSHLLSILYTALFIYFNSITFKSILLNHIGNISYAIYLIHFPLMYIVINRMEYIFLLYVSSYILSKIDSYIYKYMKNKIYYILTGFLLSFIIGYTTLYCFERSINNRKTFQKYENYTNIPLSSYICQIYNHNYSSILIIGDSHSHPLIGITYNYCKNNGILLYYKCIHTTHLMFSQYNRLQDINMHFSIIILTVHFEKKLHLNSTHLIEKVRNYIIYLKDYSNYIFYIIPTPYLLKELSCRNQIKMKYAIRDIDIHTNYINVDIIKNMKNVDVLNFTNFFCSDRYCNLTQSKNCIYMDSNHFLDNLLNIFTPYVINHIKSYNFENEKKSPVFYNNSYILWNNSMNKYWRIPQKDCKIDYIDVPF